MFDDQRRFGGPQGILKRFIDTLCRTGDDYGMRIDRFPVVTYGNFNASQQAIHRDCEDLYNRIAREKRGPPEMLFFVIKGRSAIVYEHVKQYCDTIRGIQSQAVDAFNVIRKGGDRAYHANLLLKVNSKLGGTTVTLETNFTDAKTPTVTPTHQVFWVNVVDVYRCRRFSSCCGVETTFACNNGRFRGP